VRGTVRWTAPELFDDIVLLHSTPSDMYSFGCVCCEIFSGMVPFQHLKNDAAVIFSVIQGQRPKHPPVDLCHAHGLDDDMWVFMQKLWTTLPSDRPSARKAVKYLSSRPNLGIDTRLPCDWNESFTKRPPSDLTVQSNLLGKAYAEFIAALGIMS